MAEAEAKLKEQGLVLKATEVENSQVAPGKVTGQADAADSLVEQGKTITVTVAKAPAPPPPPPSPTPTPTPTKSACQRGRGPGRTVPLTRSGKTEGAGYRRAGAFGACRVSA